MKTLSQTIYVSKKTSEHIWRLLNYQPVDEAECFGEDETLVYTAAFPDGVEADIKVCGVQYDPNADDNTAWCEGVLFVNGSEVMCSDVTDTFVGEWSFLYNDTLYVVNIDIGDGT